jgi:hypothetical protein
LARHCPRFTLWVLCFDDATFDLLRESGLPGLEPIRLSEFEAGDEALLAAKTNRPRVEYYFTCTPSLPRYLLARHAQIDLIVYLDADMYFYSSPEPVFRELADASVGIIEHRWPPGMAHMNAYGRFNVGLVAFRRDEQAAACLARWRERCLESCGQDLAAGRYGDQKYLDEWPVRFSGVAILRHKGANAAVWNLPSCRITRTAGGIVLDDDPLLFFHFHGLKRLRPWLFDFHFSFYGVEPGNAVVRGIFAPYLRSLLKHERAVAARPAVGNQVMTAAFLATNLLRRNFGTVFLGRLVAAPWWLTALYLALRRGRDSARCMTA